MFPYPHLNTRGSWENWRQLCKPETQSRVCITVLNTPNSPECLDEAMETWKKVLYCFYKIFLKDNSTDVPENAVFFTSRLKQIFLIHAQGCCLRKF